MIQPNNKPLLFFILFILLISFNTTSLLASEKFQIKEGTFTRIPILNGSIKAEKAERFVVPVSDTWQIQLKWMAPEGQIIKPGDPVVRFNTANLATTIDNLERDLKLKKEQRDQKIAELSQKKMELDVQVQKASIEFQKNKLDASVPVELTTKADYDKTQLQKKKSFSNFQNAQLNKKVKMAELEAEIDRMALEIEEAKTELTKNKNRLNDMTLYAKTTGALIYQNHPWFQRKFKIGEMVAVTMVIAIIPDVNTLQVEAWVDETDLPLLKCGQKVKVTLDAYPNRFFNGTISYISNNGEDKPLWSKTHYFRVNLQLAQHDLAIMKAGMSARCYVQAVNYPNVLLIPIAAAYYDDHDFWIKPSGQSPIKIPNPIFNESYLLQEKNNKLNINAATILEPIKPTDIPTPSKTTAKEKIHEKN